MIASLASDDCESQQIGDLAPIPANREAFKAAVSKAYPAFKPGAVPNSVGQLYRFVHEMKKVDGRGPNFLDRSSAIGHATGCRHIHEFTSLRRESGTSPFWLEKVRSAPSPPCCCCTPLTSYSPVS